MKVFPKAPLARTAEDHYRIGSTPDMVLQKSPKKRFHETMDATKLWDYICRQMVSVMIHHQMALTGEARLVRAFKNAYHDRFMPDIEYLREIERLPSDLQDFDFEKAFALPEHLRDVE